MQSRGLTHRDVSHEREREAKESMLLTRLNDDDDDDDQEEVEE